MREALEREHRGVGGAGARGPDHPVCFSGAQVSLEQPGASGQGLPAQRERGHGALEELWRGQDLAGAPGLGHQGAMARAGRRGDRGAFYLPSPPGERPGGEGADHGFGSGRLCRSAIQPGVHLGGRQLAAVSQHRHEERGEADGVLGRLVGDPDGFPEQDPQDLERAGPGDHPLEPEEPLAGALPRHVRPGQQFQLEAGLQKRRDGGEL